MTNIFGQDMDWVNESSSKSKKRALMGIPSADQQDPKWITNGYEVLDQSVEHKTVNLQKKKEVNAKKFIDTLEGNL